MNKPKVWSGISVVALTIVIFGSTAQSQDYNQAQRHTGNVNSGLTYEQSLNIQGYQRPGHLGSSTRLGSSNGDRRYYTLPQYAEPPQASRLQEYPGGSYGSGIIEQPTGPIPGWKTWDPAPVYVPPPRAYAPSAPMVIQPRPQPTVQVPPRVIEQAPPAIQPPPPTPPGTQVDSEVVEPVVPNPLVTVPLLRKKPLVPSDAAPVAPSGPRILGDVTTSAPNTAPEGAQQKYEYPGSAI
jgi:hypothetical protein